MSTETIVQLHDIRREFDSIVAVSDVSLDVPKGAVLALVGPNGAGKSTLMKMIAALLEPTSGTARVCGLDVSEEPRSVHTCLGFLPDFFGLYDNLSVRDYLDYFARAYRLSHHERSQRVREALSQVELENQAEYLIGNLSRGMRQRLGIARTLIHNPPLLLLDEPASGLDPEARMSLQCLFRQMAQSGKTLIVSSHILTELEEYCTHVAILKEGKLVVSGAVQDVRVSLSRGRCIRIRVLEEAGRMEGILSEDNLVKHWMSEGNGGQFEYTGDERGLAALLRRLIDAGVPVTFFGEDRGNIQDTYLSLMESRRPDDTR